ncbi:MAG: hypothetical protein GX936_01470 [Clostridiales bacterium]|jgi:hypothetical protein|nr:hypothetical protein [Clostridiales bacterium]
MEGNIRVYVEELFAGTTPSKRAVELKEEMIQNLTEKYNDLLSEGKPPEAAFNIAVAGIGDISYLLKDLEKDAMHPDVIAAQRHRSAMLTAVAIMMYILSVVPLIILGALTHGSTGPLIGLVIMFIFIAAATGLLIYNGMTKPKYMKTDDTMVEEFKQWQAESAEKKSLRNSVSSAMWAVILAVYFLVSFLTGAWHISWVIFIVGGAVQSIINIAFTVKK